MSSSSSRQKTIKAVEITDLVEQDGGEGRGVRSRGVRSNSVSIDLRLCAFCHQGLGACRENSLLKSGKFFSFGGLHFHYFCVLFSKDAVQRGQDDEGLCGFLYPDIKKELLRGQKLKCVFCLRTGATASCEKRGCNQIFHWTCGHQEGSVYIFKDLYPSYCKQHAPKQHRVKMKVEDKTCLAGCSEVTRDTERCMVSPCCGRRYHITCLQGMALQSGRQYYKCPVCFDKTKILKESLTLGVYVPEQDASWEQGDFYDFSAQGRLPQKCDAETCFCSKGREYHMAGTDFEVIRCNYCGSNGVHIKCGGLDKYQPDFICDEHEESTSKKTTSSAAKRARLLSSEARTTSTAADSSDSSDGDDDDDDSPPSDSDTSIDDEVVNSRMKQPSPIILSSPASSSEESDDDITIVEEIQREPGKAEHLRRTNSIAGLLSEASLVVSDANFVIQDGQHPAIVPSTSTNEHRTHWRDLSADASWSSSNDDNNTVPNEFEFVETSNPRLKIVAFGSLATGSHSIPGGQNVPVQRIQPMRPEDEAAEKAPPMYWERVGSSSGGSAMSATGSHSIQGGQNVLVQRIQPMQAAERMSAAPMYWERVGSSSGGSVMSALSGYRPNVAHVEAEVINLDSDDEEDVVLLD